MVQAPPRWTEYRVSDALLDDTEESIVGTEWHQEAISSLMGMLREAARRQGASWDACEQIALTGLRRTDGRPYDPRPDVMVLAHPLSSGAISSISLADAGAPLFIVEVASRSTVREDVGEKRQVYEAIGAQEYIVYDPEGALLSAPLRAWRLDGEVYVPWSAAEDGLWHSRALGVAIEPAQPLLGMRDWGGSLLTRLAASGSARTRRPCWSGACVNWKTRCVAYGRAPTRSNGRRQPIVSSRCYVCLVLYQRLRRNEGMSNWSRSLPRSGWG